jgi:hypothetical protein
MLANVLLKPGLAPSRRWAICWTLSWKGNLRNVAVIDEHFGMG